MLVLVPICTNAQEQNDLNNDNNTASGNVTTQVVTGANNIINGTGAMAGSGNQNTAVGTSIQVVNGNSNVVDGFGALSVAGDGNTAIGVNAQVINGNGNKSIGFGAQAGGGNYNTAIGRGTHAVYGDQNTAIGSGAYAGGNKAAISQSNTAIGFGAQATTGDSVALGAYSVADRTSSVSVGSPGYERQITNVAPGYYDTDAVNMSQLRGVESKVNRVGATSFAFSALAPLSYDPKEPTQYSAGIGTYSGTSAFAVGIYHYTKPDVMVNAAIGMSNDGWEKSARFGISWRTGGPKYKELNPAMPIEVKENIAERVKIILSDD